MLTLHLLICLAGATVSEHASVDRAEYIRLAGEIRTLSERSAWRGVEQAYRAAVETSHPLAFGDHLAGAHAAGSAGDVLSVRQRLAEAHRLREDRTVIEWMWRLDRSYGKVDLVMPQGSELVAVAMPFDPAQAQAVRFATQSLLETGRFHGYLPEGRYRIGEVVFDARPGSELTEVVHTPSRRARLRRPARRERVTLEP